MLQPRLAAELELLDLLDELELLIAVTEELLLDELWGAELDVATTTADDELVATAELVLLEELVATEELLVEDGIGSVCAGGLLGGVSVAAPPHALKTKTAAKSSERDCSFMLIIH